MQTSLTHQKRSATAVMLLLLALFLLGAGIIYNGVFAMRRYASSGFSSEAASAA